VRVLLRLIAAVALAGAIYLTIYQPKATVVGANLITKVNVGVQCSSVWDQWTNHAKPATLALNGTAITQLPAAQSSCQSASHKIKYIGGGLVAGAVVIFVLSFARLRRRPRVQAGQPAQR
jgi:hypothetical protein